MAVLLPKQRRNSIGLILKFFHAQRQWISIARFRLRRAVRRGYRRLPQPLDRLEPRVFCVDYHKTGTRSSGSSRVQDCAPGGDAAISWIRPGDPRIADESEPLLSALCRYGPRHFGDNLGGQMRLIRAFGTTIPVLVAEAGRELCDVCSPISRYVSYPLEEARRRGRSWQLPLLNAGAGLMGAALARLGVERVVYVNNWLLSTNPPLRLNRLQLAVLTSWLAGEFSDHAIVYRTVNPALEPELTGNLLAAGCRLLTTRLVYVIDPRQAAFQRHSDVRRDLRLLENSRYQLSHDKAALSEGDLQRMTDLYQRLYISKHCRHNAHFNAAFFARMLATPMVRASFFRDPESGRLDAFSLYTDSGSYLTGFQIGYDQALPQRLGLYRMALMHKVLLAQRRGLLVNLSGGAGSFKCQRGAKPVREYDALFDRHLSRCRRLPWRLVSLESRLFGRLRFD